MDQPNLQRSKTEKWSSKRRLTFNKKKAKAAVRGVVTSDSNGPVEAKPKAVLLEKVQQDVMAKWARPLVECSVGADLPRLGNKHEVRGEDGSVVLHPSMDENAKPFETVSELFRVLHGQFGRTEEYDMLFAEHFRASINDPQSTADIAQTSNEYCDKLGEDHPVCKLLKASCSQGIVSPAWIKIKLELLREHPFKDVKMGWNVYVLFSKSEVIVIHKKREQGQKQLVDATTEEVKAPFEFTWELKIVFDRSMTVFKNATFAISHLTAHDKQTFDLLHNILSEWRETTFVPEIGETMAPVDLFGADLSDLSMDEIFNGALDIPTLELIIQKEVKEAEEHRQRMTRDEEVKDSNSVSQRKNSEPKKVSIMDDKKSPDTKIANKKGNAGGGPILPPETLFLRLSGTSPRRNNNLISSHKEKELPPIPKHGEKYFAAQHRQEHQQSLQAQQQAHPVQAPQEYSPSSAGDLRNSLHDLISQILDNERVREEEFEKMLSRERERERELQKSLDRQKTHENGIKLLLERERDREIERERIRSEWEEAKRKQEDEWEKERKREEEEKKRKDGGVKEKERLKELEITLDKERERKMLVEKELRELREREKQSEGEVKLLREEVRTMKLEKIERSEELELQLIARAEIEAKRRLQREIEEQQKIARNKLRLALEVEKEREREKLREELAKEKAEWRARVSEERDKVMKAWKELDDREKKFMGIVSHMHKEEGKDKIPTLHSSSALTCSSPASSQKLRPHSHEPSDSEGELGPSATTNANANLPQRRTINPARLSMSISALSTRLNSFLSFLRTNLNSLQSLDPEAKSLASLDDFFTKVLLEAKAASKIKSMEWDDIVDKAAENPLKLMEYLEDITKGMMQLSSTCSTNLGLVVDSVEKQNIIQVINKFVLSIVGVGTFSKRAMTCNFDDLHEFEADYVELRAVYLAHVKELCNIIKRYLPRHKQRSKFFELCLSDDCAAIATKIHEWMKNGPFFVYDLERVLGCPVSNNIMESIAVYAGLTKEMLSQLEQADPTIFGGFIDNVACLHLYLSAFIIPAVPRKMEVDFVQRFEVLGGIMVQLVICLLRDDREKRERLKSEFNLIFRDISLIVKQIMMAQQ